MISILAHKLTPEQLTSLGRVPIHISELDRELAALIADCPAARSMLFDMARRLVNHALKDEDGIILAGSGSPAFTACLGICLGADRDADRVRLLFAHSERISEDQLQPDGSVRKISIFKHVKFFEV
jgi:hypothetical protein